MPTLLALLLLTAFPSSSRTSWMRPDAFRLAIGMPRTEAVRVLETWSPKAGANPNELIVDYSHDKALTLDFRNDRLTSIRFELFEYLPSIRTAYREQQQHLLKVHGKPRTSTRSILVYDNVLPNVMVVVTDDPNSAQGKKGLGVLAVRYYDPRV